MVEGSISKSKMDERVKEIVLGEKIGKLMVEEPRPRKRDLFRVEGSLPSHISTIFSKVNFNFYL